MSVAKKIRLMIGIPLLILIVGGVGWGFHAWNRGLIDEAKHAAPDGINVFPVVGKPGTYLVNPGFAHIASVQTFQNQIPNPDGPPPIIQDIRREHWRYDGATSLLILDQPIDDKQYMMMVQGDFRYPLVFFVAPTTKVDSIRVIVAGKIGIENEDYRFDKDRSSIELSATTRTTPWFALVYDTAEGNFSIGSLSAEQLTRAMRIHLGLQLEGNCKARDTIGRQFQTEAGTRAKPWQVELFPIKEGYRGQAFWPRDYSWDPSTGILEFDKPIDVSRFAVFAYYWTEP